jgi:Zinc carboxypeptidase
MRGCSRFVCLTLLLVAFASNPSFSQSSSPASSANPLENTFDKGWMLTDTNGDGIADFLRGHIVVPPSPTAAENAAAANLAARLAYGTTGLTLPVVETTTQSAVQIGPKIFINSGSMPASVSSELAPLISQLGPGEGGVFLSGGNLAVIGADAPGLLAAANGFSAHAPYQWASPGGKIEMIVEAIGKVLAAAKINAAVRLVGLTYVDKEPGIRRAFLRLSGNASSAAIRKALAPEGKTPVHFAAVRELVVLSGSVPPITLLNPVPMALLAAGPLPPITPHALDLGQLYTISGLLGGSSKMPIPDAIDSRLFVPGGNAGVAMANLAARLGLESTGISLPLAYVPSGVSLAQVKSQAVVTEDSSLGKQMLAKLSTTKDQQGNPFEKEILSPLAPGEGEIRAVDDAFAKHSALLVRGDAAGQAAALDYAAGRLPFLWQPNKRYESTDEIRFDLHRFFSLRSSAGQAAVALYHLDRWLEQAAAQNAKPASLDATVYVDKADPHLSSFIRRQLEQRAPGAKVTVHTGSLHAGLKCCTSDPPLHYVSPLHPFVQAAPTFTDDFTIPWEGRRLLEKVRSAANQLERGQPVELRAEVSEGPAELLKLKAQLERILFSAGAAPARTRVELLCAYKPGYSWLLDDIAPELRGRAVSRMVIEFRPDLDPAHTSMLYSRSRWLQELYPVDEMLGRALHIPFERIQFKEMASATGPTYRVEAYDAGGQQLLSREFTVHAATEPYSGPFPEYDHVQVDTGWVHLISGSRTILDERIKTDEEMFWEHYQNITLPKIFHFIMAQNDGDPKVEYQPLFDTLRLKIHLSEPDYNLGLDHERISSLEALQEDTFYSTQNFFYMLGTLDSTGLFDYMGRVIPVVYPSTDGQDGHIQIEFYAKDGPHPLVSMNWTDTAGRAHSETRALPALQMGMPRLVAARVKAGEAGVQSLTWELSADSREDHYHDWIAKESANAVEHSMFSVQQAEGQIHWLKAMHSAGLYPNSLAYPHLDKLVMEFQLPRPLRAPENSRSSLVHVSWAVPKPATPRPQITDYTPRAMPSAPSGHFVSWQEPISAEQSAEILARLAKFPGFTVYWMGRTYLGENIWAADIMEPSPAELRSPAKEETLKAVIVYSGRQHANEVSSTNHVLRLAEELVRDSATRAMLKKVNVVIHPIDNPDGANLSIDLMHIDPDFLVHPGYHGALTADVQSGLWETDPIYPESRTRRQLWEEWLPDSFINPHGYPSHEWVQPFSGYTAWMIRRTGVESGRTWWIPRGWFTSLGYLDGPDYPHNKDIAYEMRERIADNFAKVPGAMALESRMNSRYDRYGVPWEPRSFQMQIYKGVRIYMSLKGVRSAPGGEGFMARFPKVTWDEGYTEAPDETAHGDYLHLLAEMGFAYDMAHLTYLDDGKFKITRTEKDYSDGVLWKFDRQRPVLPSTWLIKSGPGVEEK